MADSPYGTIYITGPMTGKKDLNRPSFAECKMDLESLYPYATIVSPPDLDGEGVQPWETCLKRDLKIVVDAVALVAIEGWRQSRGARLETGVAATVGIPVFRYPSFRRIHVEPLG
jgi:hypothetical protein